MNTSPVETASVDAQSVRLTEDELVVELTDGRTIMVPIVWFPRLSHGTPEERNNWELLGGGMGIHWEDLDEDISVSGLLAGRKSAETQASLQRWLDSRLPKAQPDRSKKSRKQVEPSPGEVRFVRRDTGGRSSTDQVEAGRSLGRNVRKGAKPSTTAPERNTNK
jgi:hypothetical protein